MPRGRGGRRNTCKPCANAYSQENGKKWRATHKANLDANYARWAEAHKVEIATARAVKRDGRLNAEERAARRRISKAYQIEQWRLSHKEQMAPFRRRACMRRYARKKGAAGHATADQIRQRWAFFGDRCWICGVDATQTDHVIPLNQGGSDWPSNQRPICGSCNPSKSDLRLDVSEVRTFTALAFAA